MKKDKKAKVLKATRKGRCLKQDKILAPYLGVCDTQGELWVAAHRRQGRDGEYLSDYMADMKKHGWRVVKVTITEV